VGLKVDVILTLGTPSALAARAATALIPIASVGMGDPLGNGLVASLARPGGNLTGLSVQSIDLAGKRLELLREVVPRLYRLAILANVGNPANVLEMGEVQAAGRALGLKVATLEIRRAEDIAPGFETLKGGADVLYVPGDPLLTTYRTRISILALQHVPFIVVHSQHA
jgi:putative tryptophan/tyrosine transport system substrate-binding protein